MKVTKLACLIMGLMLFSFNPVLASDTHGTKEEAKAMAEKAAALVKENHDSAFATFQKKDSGFIDRDLYVFVFDSKGNFKAHGAKPVLVGKGGLAMKDVSGFPFVQAFLNVKDTDWVDYKWPDVMDEGKVKNKSTYVIKVGDYTVGVGYFKD
ncbi:MAG: cache domain-containing protein [Alphaproteobacteria bacterium]|nr:cache domain-containing protein [Alphaproteobacteria bacterium]